MIILGPTYIERISSGQVATDANRRSSALNIINSLGSRLASNSPNFTENWNTDYLDNYAQKHVEKWVEKIGLHFLRYSQAQQTPTLVGLPLPTSLVHRQSGIQAERLTQKVFSGDVSGSIAETLFAVLMIQHYGLIQNRLTHLRGTKSTGPSPDFYISQISSKLAQDLDPSRKINTNTPLVCECKGATQFDYRAIFDKLSYAFEQLDSLMSGACYIAKIKTTRFRSKIN